MTFSALVRLSMSYARGSSFVYKKIRERKKQNKTKTDIQTDRQRDKDRQIDREYAYHGPVVISLGFGGSRDQMRGWIDAGGGAATVQPTFLSPDPRS